MPLFAGRAAPRELQHRFGDVRARTPLLDQGDECGDASRRPIAVVHGDRRLVSPAIAAARAEKADQVRPAGQPNRVGSVSDPRPASRATRSPVAAECHPRRRSAGGSRRLALDRRRPGRTRPRRGDPKSDRDAEGGDTPRGRTHAGDRQRPDPGLPRAALAERRAARSRGTAGRVRRPGARTSRVAPRVPHVFAWK